MAKVNLSELQPTVIDKSLKGKYLLIYGLPKIGKTTLATQLPDNLILGCEHGWNALAGIHAVDVESWTDFKFYVKELRDEDNKKKFKTITIDTIGILWELCEKFICQQNQVTAIGDIPYGAGYAATTAEFSKNIRELVQLGYGLCFIAHVDRRTEKVELPDKFTPEGKPVTIEMEYFSPLMAKRCYAIVNQIVDIVGYIEEEWDEKGQTSRRYIHTKNRPTVVAGSRFTPYLDAKIPYGYTNLLNALIRAIELKEKEGALASEHGQTQVTQDLNMSYDELREEASRIWTQYVGQSQSDEENKNRERILKILEDVFGRPTKFSSIPEEQIDLYSYALIQIKNEFK